jgi:DNA-binding NtrC family response regulator
MLCIGMARILVVDDEALIREVLLRRLTQWGHDVAIAHSAEGALSEMEKAPAQIVFSDVIMPLHDGLWLVQQLRERWPDTVIVAVSGALELQTVVKMREFGAIDYVTKPIGREMLHQALQRALARIPS